jgi:hypothetical protein
MGTVFDVETQKGLNWCWAAVSVSVDHYFSPSEWDQCKLAQDVLQVAGGCCGNPLPADCDQGTGLQNGLSKVGRLQETLAGHRLLPDEVRGHIDDCVPVCCRIGWFNETKGHAVVIYGYSIDSAGVLWLEIADPLYLNSTMPYSQFANSYLDVGSWTDTFLVSADGKGK